MQNENHQLSLNSQIQLMRSLILSFFLLLAYSISYSQSNGIVKGKLVDTALKQSLSAATVSVMSRNDSSFAGFIMTDKKGMFEIRSLSMGDYFLMASYTGYENFILNFSISKEKKTVDAGELNMQKRFKTLEGVTVTDAVPVRIHGDTISFKVEAFNSRPDATVEDVLKKLPGIQVQKDGTIHAMGETVQKVYVNGKEFFGNDPKIATKNLTADMVDQIQVYDDMSEQAKFTKIDDGSRSKTINIKLKKNMNRGDFGRFTAGGGTGERYEGNLSYNRFRDDQKVSVVGSANNTNKQSYSFNDASSSGSSTQFSQSGSGGGFSGGGMNAAPGGGASNGISIPKSAGINYNDMWGSKIDFRTSYFFANSEYFLNQNSFKKYSFPGDSSSEAITNSNARNENNSHRVNARWEFNIDSANSLLYTANLNIQNSDNAYTDTSFTISNAVNNYLALTATAGRNDVRNGINYSGELLFRRRFRVAGRTFTLGWRNGFYENDANNRSFNPITTYNSSGAIVNYLNFNQQNLQLAENNNNTISASYTEPAGKNKLIEFNYAYSGGKNISDKKTYDYNPVSSKYDLVNLFQTNYFDYRNTSHRIGSNYRSQKTKYNYQLGMAVQQSELETKSVKAVTGKDTTISQRFVNIFPSANFNYTISRAKNIRVYYRGRTNAPNISQLQDVPDYSNPLQIKTGNASLKQEFISNINLGYSTYNPKSFNFFSANISFNTTGNKIVNTIDSVGAVSVIIKPENLNGSYSTSGMFTFGIPFKKMRGANLNISTMAYYNRDVSRIYGKRNFTKLMMINQSFGFTYSKPKFDLGVAGSFVYNKVNYAFQGGTNTEYFKQSWSADFSYRFKNNFFIITDLDYFINSGRTEGFNQNILSWNIALAKQVFKNKAGEIKLTAYDILNQSKGINRTVGDNYFDDTRSNVVPRFFLLSFTYTLKQKALRKPQPKQDPKQPPVKMQVFQ